MDPVLVVGAGLAGLACAVTLTEAGLPVLLLEAQDGPGGRVRTDLLDGFQLDRGFQVYLTAYPEGRRFFSLPELDLRPFHPGALVRQRGRFRALTDPWRRPLQALADWLRDPISPADGLATLRLRAGARPGPEETALQTLQRLGFSPGLIETFLKPWFGGVLLDRELGAAGRQLDFIFGMMARGETTLPARGMAALPRQLAARLPEGCLRLGAQVAEIGPRRVTMATGEELRGAAVVLAVEGPAAHRLVPGLPDPGSRSVWCFYHGAPAPPGRQAPGSPLPGPVLILNGDEEGPINHLAVLSEVAPSYAPPGQALISTTVLGRGDTPEATLLAEVETQLARWYGPQVEGWRSLRAYHVAHAQPCQTPAALARRRQLPSLPEGLTLCGDYLTDASIQGALASGRAAAETLLAGRDRPA